MKTPFVKLSTHLKLTSERDSLLYDLDRRDETIKELADIIRAHDQLIYSMTKCSDWPTMRPYFTELQRGQCSRQRAESDRITNIIRRELLSDYTKP